MNIIESVKMLPSCPGVYLMKDSLDNIIYVGKSKNLKSRVGSYFQNSKSHSPKVIKLVQNLKSFEYIVTDTEFEAFLLECKLIKKIKPRYNKQMKNPKSYSYIKVNLREEYPSIEISNESNIDDKNIYFGPYASKSRLEKALHSIKEYFKILCNSNLQKTSSCINYSLGLCIGMCLYNDSKEKYYTILTKIVNLLNGIDKSILEEMEYKMLNASEKFDFVNAAKYRDYISAINYLLNKINVVKFIKENENIIVVEYLSDDSVKFFLIKGYEVLFKEKYYFNDSTLENLKDVLRANILFYLNNYKSKDLAEISKEEIDESQIIYTYLKSKSNNFKYISISNKWLDSSKQNSNINNSLDELLSN